jgi:hypothetical protein
MKNFDQAPQRFCFQPYPQSHFFIGTPNLIQFNRIFHKGCPNGSSFDHHTEMAAAGTELRQAASLSGHLPVRYSYAVFCISSVRQNGI